jgi:hypothetical protein
MVDTLFTRVAPGRYLSAIPLVPGLGPALVEALGDRVGPHRFGPTLGEEDGDAFWEITVGAEIATQLSCDLELVKMLAGAAELSEAELESLARVCNAARIAIPDGEHDIRWQLLTAVCSEATESMLEE